MNALAPAALAASPLFFFLLFWRLPKRRAAIASFLLAWLFLPVVVYPIDGLPDISKLFVTCFGLLLAILLFDFRRVISFRPALVDIPMAVWCLVPIATSVVNGLGLYDGLSESFGQVITWGIPYFIGRLYITDWDGIRELAVGIMLAALIYTPFLLVEMRLSPQFHRWVYGDHQHVFLQTIRFGGFRPMVFMHHGLMLAFFMMVAALLAAWMWRARTLAAIKIGRVQLPFLPVVVVLVIFTLLMRSVNAWVWLGLGLTVLFVSQRWRTMAPLLALIAITTLYMLLQGTSIWPTDTAVDFTTGLIGPERSQSLEFRYYNEEYLTAKARQQILFGWAGWDRQHVFFEWGSRTVADALWVITLGKFGVVGLTSLILSLILPSIVFMRRYRPWLWLHPRVAPAAVLAIVLVLFTMDSLLNAMVNPVYMLTAGGLMGAYAGFGETADIEGRQQGSIAYSGGKVAAPRRSLPGVPVSRADSS